MNKKRLLNREGVPSRENESESESESNDIEELIVEYFSNPRADLEDESIHAYAESKGLEADDFEEACYGLLHSLFARGDSAGMTEDDFDEDLLEEGAEHEMEHTDSECIAEKIAMDHLAEDKSYYKKLDAAGL